MKTSEAIANLWNQNSNVPNINIFNALRTTTLLIAESENKDGWSWNEETQVQAIYDANEPTEWTARGFLLSRFIQNSRSIWAETPLFSEQEYFDMVTQDWGSYEKSDNGFNQEWSKKEKMIAETDILSSMYRHDLDSSATPKNYSQKVACWLFDQANLFTTEESLDKLLCSATESNSLEVLDWAFKHGANPNAKVLKHRPGYEIPIVAIAPSLDVFNLYLANGLDPEITTAKDESLSSFVQSRSEYVFQFVRGERPKLLKNILQLESKVQKDPQTHLWRLVLKSDKVGDAVAAARSIKAVDTLRDSKGRHLIQYALITSPEAVSALLNTNKKIASLMGTPDEKGRQTQSYYLASNTAQSQTGQTNVTFGFKSFDDAAHLKQVWSEAYDIVREQCVPNVGLFSSSVESLFFDKTGQDFAEFLNNEFIPDHPDFYKEMLKWQSDCVEGEPERRRSTSDNFSYSNRNQIYKELGHSYGSERSSVIWHQWIVDNSKPKDEYELIFKVQFKLAALRMGSGYTKVFDPENLNEKNKVIEKNIREYLFEYGTPDIFEKITGMLEKKYLATSEGDSNFFSKSEWWRNIGTQIERNCLLDRQKSVTSKKVNHFDGAL